jgi:hypothetical protein
MEQIGWVKKGWIKEGRADCISLERRRTINSARFPENRFKHLLLPKRRKTVGFDGSYLKKDMFHRTASRIAKKERVYVNIKMVSISSSKFSPNS